MDLIKIGKFISTCRKEQNLTQADLAEKLGISDRAISKWENGNCLPDAGKMLDLCAILKINAGELLSGEKIKMEEMDKKTEGLLVELARRDEAKNKTMILNMYVLSATTIAFYIGSVLLAAHTLKEGPLLAAIVAAATVLTLTALFFAFKLEVDAGRYKCKKCGCKFVPSYSAALLAPHINTTRWLKCPECGKRSWARKELGEEK